MNLEIQKLCEAADPAFKEGSCVHYNEDGSYFIFWVIGLCPNGFCRQPIGCRLELRAEPLDKHVLFIQHLFSGCAGCEDKEINDKLHLMTAEEKTAFFKERAASEAEHAA